MSTRALYTFLGEDKPINIYKHSDGYPSGALSTLQMALSTFAWKLPRYEADEFAGAFCAAGKAWWLDYILEAAAYEKNPVGEAPIYKTVDEVIQKFVRGENAYTGGGIRVFESGDPKKGWPRWCSDIEYRYEISENNGKLHVKCIKPSMKYNKDYSKILSTSEKVLFEGDLALFEAWVASEEGGEHG